MKRNQSFMSIGEISKRTGLAVSAIRFYETQNLVTPIRNSGGQRLFKPSDIRRLSFVMIAQQLGFGLDMIQDQLSNLPENRTPTKSDWTRISKAFKVQLNSKIDQLVQLRNQLDGCIGCGCLSLNSCKLYNPDDQAYRLGKGPRYLLGDKPPGLK